jgi:hypothetical protein
MSDLYIMQNHLGLIKVGKTINCTNKRRLGVQHHDLCHVKVVRVAKNKGSKEAALLRRLSSSNLIGEWFDGEEDTKNEILRWLRLTKIDWPYKLADDEQIDLWLDRISKNREMKSQEQLSQRFIHKMQNFYDRNGEWDNNHCNWKIGEIIYRYDLGQNFLTFYTMVENVKEYIVYPDDDSSTFLLPKYTTRIEDALKVFPEHQKPNYWEGSIWDCCIQGLVKRREGMIERRKALQSSWAEADKQKAADAGRFISAR